MVFDRKFGLFQWAINPGANGVDRDHGIEEFRPAIAR